MSHFRFAYLPDRRDRGVRHYSCERTLINPLLIHPYRQAWPLAPAYGAIAGHIIGSLVAVFSVGLGLLVEQGRKIKDE